MAWKGKMTKVEIFCLVAAAIFTFSVLLGHFCVLGRTESGITTRYDRTWALPERIDINTATAEELQVLPGIGEVLARRIVEHRAANGNFEILEDLLAVEGIGLSTLEALADMVAIGGER